MIEDNYKNLLEYISCVECQADLVYKEPAKFLCKRCSKEYDFIDGIPDFYYYKNENNYWRDIFCKTVNSEKDFFKQVRYISARSFEIVKSCIRKLVGKLENKIIADIGCGHGLMTKCYTNNNIVFGVDISIDMLRIARDNRLIPFIADGMNPCLKKEKFDAVLCIQTLQYIKDVEGFLYKLASLLKPGGFMVISALNYYSIIRQISKTLNMVSDKDKTEILHKPLVAVDALEKLEKYDVELFYLYYPFSFIRKSAEKTNSFTATNFILRIIRK